MASDYAAIKDYNYGRYGWDIERVGNIYLSNRYSDRTHFIYELLQNAEDALRKRRGWNGSRAVEFQLSQSAIRISHFGQPFDESDVRGICGIGESTKELTDIGRFGIGFKSVYAFTDCPEIHSGEEHFAIESMVWPEAVPAINANAEETVFILPFRGDDAAAFDEVGTGLARLGSRTLLFLRQIEEIRWSVEGGPSGRYWRRESESVDENARKVVVASEQQGTDATAETWLIFSEEAVMKEDGQRKAFTEVAFRLRKTEDDTGWRVQPISDSALVAFFPTIVTTHLGFLVQGPYRTTPSRDNVPQNDAWNQALVRVTAWLLVKALHSLRDMGLLDAAALSSLPLDRDRFPAGSRFAPFFDAVRTAVLAEPLLPRHGGGHVAGRSAKLSRSQDLRGLFGPSHLTALYEAPQKLSWLSGDITSDRTPQLRQYVMRELAVAEVTSETIVPKLTKQYLEAQSDSWVSRLYEFLNRQPSLVKQGKLDAIPVVRLEAGTHVCARRSGQPQAFLPGPAETGFPTVRRRVCRSKAAKQFLNSLGLTEPDLVDDVVRNIIPRYAGNTTTLDSYEHDIQQIVRAFRTDSKAQRDKLVRALSACSFVVSVDTGTGQKWKSRPGDVYIATQRLKELFEGVAGVKIVDDSLDCLHGEDVRDLLVACGGNRYLVPTKVDCILTSEQRREIRSKSWHSECTYEEGIDDYTLRGVDGFLSILPYLPLDEAVRRARVLWDALCDCEDQGARGAFTATYRWFRYSHQSRDFDSAICRRLNECAWVPYGNGQLKRPSEVLFRETGWKENAFLLSKIAFEPPVIEVLAKEAGIEAGALNLLARLDITTEAELRARLNIEEPAQEDEEEDAPLDETPEGALAKMGIPPATAPTDDPGDKEGSSVNGGSGHGGGGNGGHGGTGSGGQHMGGTGHGGGSHSQGNPNGHHDGGGPRTFISYIATDPDDEERDPDGLSHEARMALEECAIKFIIEQEPSLQRTTTHNHGFDLFEGDAEYSPTRWVEVKAMKRDLHSRPVGLSHTQFKCAQDHGEDYWLYVIEHADSPDRIPHLLKIQNPAGRSSTFTFDHGWISVAGVTEPDQAGEPLEAKET